MPVHGRRGVIARPSAIMSAKMGSSTSIGTNTLPGTRGPSPLPRAPLASLTMSEPIPINRPRESSNAAPLHNGCGGTVKIALSSMYSQLPAKGRREMTRAGAALSTPPKGTTKTASPAFTSSALRASATGLAARAATRERSRPSPVSWS